VKGEESTRDSQVVRTDKMMRCFSWKVSSELDECDKFDGNEVNDLLKEFLLPGVIKKLKITRCILRS